MKELITELIEFLRTASPVVWEASVRQAVIVGYVRLIWPIAASVVITIVLRLSASLRKSTDSDCREVGYFFIFIAIVIGVVGVVLLGESIPRILNPNYYAIRDLINHLK